jgi:predicted small secreted protein
MTKVLALIALLMLCSTALVGCHAEGGVDAASSVVLPQ